MSSINIMRQCLRLPSLQSTVQHRAQKKLHPIVQDKYRQMLLLCKWARVQASLLLTIYYLRKATSGTRQAKSERCLSKGEARIHVFLQPCQQYMYTSLCIEHIQSGINLQVFESPSLARYSNTSCLIQICQESPKIALHFLFSPSLSL